MAATTKDRKEELKGFVAKYPTAETAKVVDHMMEKYPDVPRSSHRAMLQRIKKALAAEPKANGKTKKPIDFNALTTSGRTSSKKPNVSAKPSRAPAPAEPKTPARKTYAPPPKEKRGPAPKTFPKVAKKDTDARRNRVVELAETTKKADATILEMVAAEFPKADEGATKAMLKLARWGIEHPDVKLSDRLKKVGVALCPSCEVKAKGEDNIQKVFGYRMEYSRRQSHCRACRKKK